MITVMAINGVAVKVFDYYCILPHQLVMILIGFGFIDGSCWPILLFVVGQNSILIGIVKYKFILTIKYWQQSCTKFA